jgi:hypothetical protein
MRGGLEARSVRLQASNPGVRWSSLIAPLRRGRPIHTIDQLEQIERLQRDHRRLASLGKHTPDATRQWIRRF